MDGHYPHSDLAGTGVPGLDDVLGGGLQRNRLYLVEGVPGSGKTTLALQFLRAEAAAGESVLCITLSETVDELHQVAESHGWTLDGVHMCEMSPSETELEPDEQATMFHPAETELAATTARLLAEVERLKPARLVLDSLSELRLLAGHPLRHRRQVLALKQYFARRHCTVLLLDDMTSGSDPDLQMHSVVHGVLRLEPQQPDFGAQRRRLRVVKYRGMAFRGGFHDYALARGGLRVFPRLVASEHRRRVDRASFASGIAALDALLGGGLDEGSSTLLLGPAGTGKSTLAAVFAHAAARRGDASALFLFDESPQMLLARCAALGMDLEPFIDNGLVRLRQVDPGEMAPGEFVHILRDEVERGARIVVIDSLNGYLHASPGERFLAVQLHELLAFLGQQGVATLLIGAHQGLIGPMTTPIDASYLADSVVLLRYFELRGAVRQAISVVKKRGGPHERTIRQFHLGPDRVRVGDALHEFRGVLTGVPVYEGPSYTSNDPVA